MQKFKNKVALITGGANGIGAATANLLAQQGATVIVGDLRPVEDAELMRAAGIEYVKLDVSSESDWKSVVTGVSARHGGLHILVNAAGIEGDVTSGNLERMSLDEWRRVIQVNLDGTFLGCREVMPVMRKQGGGSIVNISSLAAYYPTPYSVAYGASKGAVTQLTKSVALHGSQGGVKVRCNSVHPGLIATRMIDSIAAQLNKGMDAAAANAAQQYFDRVPLGGVGKPEDVASLIAFLASDDAAYITGAEYTVDGGSRLLR
ncbi:SDR family NAD(P)-dependent oxidoreductase [Noviherbaspirillum saxi]|nr:SDR family oxidoreductase [Noviherbaspirillum saxi]